MRTDNHSHIRNELERLLGEKESAHLDFKVDLHLESDGDKAEFTKDVLAIANTAEVGYIVTGVDSETGERRGVSERHTEERLNQILKDKTDPFLSVQYGEFEIDGKIHGIVRICGDDRPYVVAVPDRYGGQISTSRRKHVHVVRGTVFVRVGTQSIGTSRKHIDDMYQSSYGPIEEAEKIAREFFSVFQEEVASYDLPPDQTWVSAALYPARLVVPILDRDILSDPSFLDGFRDALLRIPYGLPERWLPNPYHRGASEDSVRINWGVDPNRPWMVLRVNVSGCLAWGRVFGTPGHQEIPLDDVQALLKFFIQAAGHIYEAYDTDQRIRRVKVFVGLRNFSNKRLVPCFRAVFGHKAFRRTNDPCQFPQDPLTSPTSALTSDPDGMAARLIDYVSRAADPIGPLP